MHCEENLRMPLHTPSPRTMLSYTFGFPIRGEGGTTRTRSGSPGSAGSRVRMEVQSFELANTLFDQGMIRSRFFGVNPR
jgi:hypothetical protein